MSVWKEIRCDLVESANDCLSHQNLGPQGFATVGELHRQARLEGWQIKGGEAICPNCRTLLAKLGDQP